MTRNLIILLLLLFLDLPSGAQIAAVTRNSTTGMLNGNLTLSTNTTLTLSGNSSLVTGNGTIRLNSSAGMLFGNVGGQLRVTGDRNHAIIARTPNATDGIALVGWSSSGASAVKATQDTNFTSPALTVWRDTSLGGLLLDSPGVLVATTGAVPASTQSAVEVSNQGVNKFKVTWDGAAMSRGQLLMRWRGAGTALPTTDLVDGDMFFLITTSKIHIRASGLWFPLN